MYVLTSYSMFTCGTMSWLFISSLVRVFGVQAATFMPVSPMPQPMLAPSSLSPSTSLNSLSSSALSSSSSSSSFPFSSSSSSSSSSAAGYTRSPDVPQRFDFLDTMSIAQLEDMVQDYDAVQEVVENMAR